MCIHEYTYSYAYMYVHEYIFIYIHVDSRGGSEQKDGEQKDGTEGGGASETCAVATLDITVETIDISTTEDNLLPRNMDKIPAPLAENMEDDLLLSPPSPSHLSNLLVGGLPSTSTICPPVGIYGCMSYVNMCKYIYIHINTNL
jgi:hypothetical protein